MTGLIKYQLPEGFLVNYTAEEIRELSGETIIKEFCKFISLNGVAQHSELWKKIRAFCIGGSSIATVKGLNPYNSVRDLLLTKVNVKPFPGDIKTQWGNLFEEIIKICVEMDKNTTVHGEDLFIDGIVIKSDYVGCVYSPDGIAVIMSNNNAIEEYSICDDDGCVISSDIVDSTPAEEIVVVEFKCPYSRVPRRDPPAYYIPQVKMGLELIPIATRGLFIEGVFRRCAWDQLDKTGSRDKTLVKQCLGDTPRKYGIIGLYIKPANMAKIPVQLVEKYNTYFDQPLSTCVVNVGPDEIVNPLTGVAPLNTHINDLGDCPPDLFIDFMHLVDSKIISVHYGSVYDASQFAKIPNWNSELDKFLDEANKIAHGSIIFGIIPWKLFALNYHWIDKSPGYLDAEIPAIKKILDCTRECALVEHNEVLPTEERQEDMYQRKIAVIDKWYPPR